MKLRGKIFISFSICISISFLLLLYITQNKMTNFNENQTNSFNQQLVQSKSNEIGSWMYQRVVELRMLSQYDDLIDGEGELNQVAINAYIQRLNKRVEGLFGNFEQTFIMVDESGIGWSKDNPHIDVSEREYFIEAMALGEGVEYTVSRPLISKIDGQRAVIICYPVRDEQGIKKSYLLGSVAVSKLEDSVSGIHIFEGSVWIMDRYGRVISEDDNHDHDYGLCPNNLSLTKTAVELQQTNNGVRTFQTKDIQGQLYYAAIPYTDGWRLCVLAEENIIYAETKNVQESIIFVWIILLLLSLFISLGFSHHIVQPVKRLQKSMGEVKNGNLDIAYNTENKDDEIAQLGQSFNAMVGRIKELLVKVTDEQKEKRMAEFRALQSQIKPHFLYNTLDTLRWKALEYNAVEIADIVNALSVFFRTSLNGGNELITLDEEVENAYHYLFIQNVRYGDKLNFDIYLQEELKNNKVIKIILQPVIENAIYHGIKPSTNKGLIDIRICCQDDLILIRIFDNGVGMDEKTLEKIRQGIQKNTQDSGYGLYNVNERIRLTYGAEYGIQVDSEQGKGTTVTILIPLKGKEVDLCTDL